MVRSRERTITAEVGSLARAQGGWGPLGIQPSQWVFKFWANRKINFFVFLMHTDFVKLNKLAIVCNWSYFNKYKIVIV